MPISSKSFTESTGETIVNIGQYLAKIWTKYDRLVTLTTELHYRTADDSANITWPCEYVQYVQQTKCVTSFR